jgi:D-alanyl-D-alanine carboxypeptidase
MLALAGACVALAAAPGAASAGLNGTGGVQSALDTLVEAEQGPPGASVLIQRGDRIQFVRSGVGDVRNGRPFHRRDHMRIASVTKAWTGMAALELVDQGRLDLDATLGELLPTVAPAAWSEVTVAQLMQHTSGVPSYTDDQQFRDDLGEDPRRYFTPEEIVGYVDEKPLGFVPGSTYKYSNTDNILVGLIIEATTGRFFRNDLRQFVYRPLGLRNTSLPSDWLIPRRYVHGYGFPPEGGPPEDVSEALSASGIWASGGIISTPVDMNEFVRAYAAGELITPATRSRQLDFRSGCGQPPGPGECSVGLSIYRYRTECGTVFGHSGNFPGYAQLIAASKNGRRSMVVSTNTQIDEPFNPEIFERFDDVNEAAVCALFTGRP